MSAEALGEELLGEVNEESLDVVRIFLYSYNHMEANSKNSPKAILKAPLASTLF